MLEMCSTSKSSMRRVRCNLPSGRKAMPMTWRKTSQAGVGTVDRQGECLLVLGPLFDEVCYGKVGFVAWLESLSLVCVWVLLPEAVHPAGSGPHAGPSELLRRGTTAISC
jgi:hypothetical protein